MILPGKPAKKDFLLKNGPNMDNCGSWKPKTTMHRPHFWAKVKKTDQNFQFYKIVIIIN